MGDINILLILLNMAYLLFLFAFVAKKIVWLRCITILGNITIMPYFFFFFDEPMWNNIAWIGVYTVTNLFMLFLIYLESRPIKLSDLEQKIYDRTFKSLNQKNLNI